MQISSLPVTGIHVLVNLSCRHKCIMCSLNFTFKSKATSVCSAAPTVLKETAFQNVMGLQLSGGCKMKAEHIKYCVRSYAMPVKYVNWMSICN